MKIITDLSKKILFNYFIKKKYEFGVVLLGWEVKSIRQNGIIISGGYLFFKKFECWLIGSFIKKPSYFNDDKSKESRDRKVLLHKKEVKNLHDILKVKNIALIPSRVYWKKSFVKIEACLGVGKKLYDKRLSSKNMDWKINAAQTLKHDI